MATFNRGDEASYIGGKSGKTIVCIVDGGLSDVVQVHWKDKPAKLRMIETAKLTLIKAAPVPSAPPVTQPKRNVLRYVCLECGKKHSSHSCPRCGSDEHILNTDADHDPSLLLGGTPAEPYAPGE